MNTQTIDTPARAGLTPVPALEALQRLREGNARFVSDVRSIDALATQSRRVSLVPAQSPFAVVLSCSDSRVPSEIVFDQGLGSLFVVRVAGNVVAPSLVGSVEFAVETFATQLVVVMGHSRCGAIAATLAALRGGASHRSENIRDIVDRIRPAVAPLLEVSSDESTLAARATRANVVAAANHLRHSSRLLEQRVASGRILVVGAEYSLESGKVDFFDGVPT
jgi:carbonic anhydrase